VSGQLHAPAALPPGKTNNNNNNNNNNTRSENVLLVQLRFLEIVYRALRTKREFLFFTETLNIIYFMSLNLHFPRNKLIKQLRVQICSFNAFI
jgi:hypothetical protein